ncbi:DUF6916 family protein [Nocardioides halotolerans]|uniref:DUF6916 family protein n=1 Tax=Nocardioides halotolerans TaxID=433660 RepID=UPI00041E1EFC|nr:hypothetical protein [Nocardioides halotolerans]
MAEPVWLTFDLFEGRVGEEFVVSAYDGPSVRTELVEAVESDRPGGAGPDGAPRSQFSLVFRGPVGPVLPQATHRVEHAELDPMDVFLVPVGSGPDGVQYQAVFA